MKENKQNDLIMKQCPSFDSCSSPTCPLDAIERPRLSGEEKCKATKRTRISIGITNNLKNFGLRKKELSGILQHYDSIGAYYMKKYATRGDLISKPPSD